MVDVIENVKLTIGVLLIVVSFLLMRPLTLSPFEGFTDLGKFISGVIILFIAIWLYKIDLKKKLG